MQGYVTNYQISTNYLLNIFQILQVSGWGAINEDKTGDSITLRRVEVTTRACVNTQFQSFSNDHVCAGAANTSAPQVGICTRDIGGPLVMNSVLVGIAFYHDPRFCGVNPVSCEFYFCKWCEKLEYFFVY